MFKYTNCFRYINYAKKYFKKTIIGIRLFKSFMQTHGIRICVIFILILTAIVFSAGCNGNKSKNQDPSAERQSAETQQQQQNEGKDSQSSTEIPMELEKLEKDIEEIIKILNGPSADSEEETEEKDKKSEQQNADETGSKQDESGKEEKKSQDKESEQKNGENKENGEENDQNSGGEQEGDQKQQDSKEGQDKEEQKEEKNQQNQKDQQEDKSQQEQGKGTRAQQPDKKDPWQDITPVIDKLHFTWNSYEPKAAKVEDSHDKLNTFSDSLNNLTNSVNSKDKLSTLVNANKCYGDIAELYSIYKKPNISEVKKLKYYTRNIILGSMKNDWSQADENMEHVKTLWDLLKNNLTENNEEYKEPSGTLDFSIKEFEKVVNEKNQDLVDLKGRIVLANIEIIDKKLKGD
ncbi:MAG TPA: hypothetical protein GXX37_04605 [Clostridiaceae bacterium]|nr:hypothetical protein [Clostridiaceae bacterium]